LRRQLAFGLWRPQERRRGLLEEPRPSARKPGWPIRVGHEVDRGDDRGKAWAVRALGAVAE